MANVLSVQEVAISNEESEFNQRFSFDPMKALYIGVERECFLKRGGKIVPEAPLVLSQLPQPHFSYELSACQLEERIGPCTLENLPGKLSFDYGLRPVLNACGLNVEHCELAPFDIPLDVFPDPAGRYQQIVKTLSVDLLRAACRVAATHIHVGMPDRDSAIRVHDVVISSFEELCRAGDHSGGERLEVYKIMARDWRPQKIGSWANYLELAVQKGFNRDPRQFWRLIRISIHGTIEFRMFGATDNLAEIESWARKCHRLCQSAL